MLGEHFRGSPRHLSDKSLVILSAGESRREGPYVGKNQVAVDGGTVLWRGGLALVLRAHPAENEISVPLDNCALVQIVAVGKMYDLISLGT